MGDETEKPTACFGYWGKARRDEDSGGEPYHLLVYHSLDVAAVGQVLLERHPFLLIRLARVMEVPQDVAKRWFVFLLGLHDLGKFAENFQQLRSDLRESMWPDRRIRRTGYTVRHDSLGKMLWDQYLRKALFSGASEPVNDFLLDVLPVWLNAVFGHHGWPPSKNDRLKNHFQTFDQEAALLFYQYWFELMGPDFNDMAKRVPNKEQQKSASWLMAGIAVLADWLGSNQEIFAFCSEPMPLEDYWNQVAIPAAGQAVGQAGLIPPQAKHGCRLGELFNYIDTPTPLQKICAEIELSREPQMFILEDVTGAGKTEAALMLAHRLMDRGLAEGIYIGLPTMATANAMYERMVQTYRKFYADDDKPSLILSHSARHLSDAFQQSLLGAQKEEHNYGAEESIVAECNRWLADNRKKALLADVGIGTIDQALLAVMPARHQSLRLLGLANKVLILDEVHAYDAYTSEPLKRLIQFHGALGGSVILLSATLTKKQRRQLVEAFQGCTAVKLEREAYPLLTHVSASSSIRETALATRDSVKRKVGVDFIHDQDQVYELIRSAVAQGQCVCWIRNTVGDARNAWQVLASEAWMDTSDLHLFHSRFAMGDRLEIEQAMLDLFGKYSKPEDRRGQVLVATQVVEQSLDLDFDVMISDLAPIDLLIQRAGRLHRHQRGERGEPLLHILGPEMTDEPDAGWYKSLFEKANYVYSHTLVLWRTAKILGEKRGWRMPDDVRDLLEFVYDEEGEIPEGLMDATLESEGDSMSKKDAGDFASLRLEPGYSGTEHWDEEAIIATRLGDDSHSVYLARWENGELTPWVNEGRYRWDLSSLRVSQAQLKTLAPIEDPALVSALNKLRETQKLFDEHTLIAPLVSDGDKWRGAGVNENERAVDLIYNPADGLELERR